MKNYIQDTLDYIEVHLDETLTLDSISEKIGYSKFYLHRAFQVYTGYPLSYYIRKRKLEYSILDLRDGMNTIDIAIKYQFSSTRSYNRAFKSIFHTTPKAFVCDHYTLPQLIDLNQIGGIKMLNYLSEVKEKELKELYVLSHVIISKNPEDEVIKFMHDIKEKLNLVVLNEYGFDYPVEGEDPEVRGYEYWLSVSKDDFEKVNTDEVVKKVVPATNYLTLSIKDPFADPFERIPNGWKAIVSEVEKHRFNDTKGLACLEEVVDDEMILYVPIKD